MIQKSTLSLNARCYKLDSAPKSSYLTYQFDDFMYNFMLFADDVGPQQDPKS